MATYISLITETQLGETQIAASVDRATRFRDEAGKFNVQVTGMYWTMGEFDGVLIFEAGKDEEAAAFLHHVTSKGTIRTHTLRAFDSDTARSILQKVASNK
jgi:uncharacterized protein with GYD domain